MIALRNLFLISRIVAPESSNYPPLSSLSLAIILDDSPTLNFLALSQFFASGCDACDSTIANFIPPSATESYSVPDY